MSLSLPKDIYDEIVDTVQDLNDVESLRNLALTSHLFLPRSQYHLFSRHVVLNSINKLNSFCDFLNAYPDRLPWVRSVTVTGFDTTDISSSFFNLVPPRLFQNFPNLYQCRIGSLSLDGYVTLDVDKFPELQGPYSRVLTHLHLLGILFQGCATFAQHILAFPALRYLECKDLYTPYGEVTDYTAAAFTQARERLSERLHLSHLSLHNVSPVWVTLLLESTRHTLQELVIDIRDHARWAVAVLTHIPYMFKLISITLEMETFNRTIEQRMPDTIQHAFEILQALVSVPNSNVTHITIHLLDHNISEVLGCPLNSPTDSDLFQMCSTLEPALLRLPRLHKIELSHELRRPLRDWTFMRIEHFLPTLCDRTRCTAPPGVQCHNDSVKALAVSPDSRWIATGSADMTIIIWDARRGTIVHERVHPSKVQSLSFSQDGRYLASASKDRKVRVWDFSEKASRCPYTLDDAHVCVWSSNGTVLSAFSADRMIIQTLDPSTNQVQSHSLQGFLLVAAPGTAIFSSDGRWFAMQSYRKWGVWETATGRQRDVAPGTAGHSWPRTTTFDPAGRRIVNVSDRHSARICDVETEEQLAVLEDQTYDMEGYIIFSPDGTRVLSTTWRDPQVVTLWDSFSGDIMLSFEAHEQQIRQVCFSPDGDHIASASLDYTVKLWDTRDGACVRTFAEHDAPVGFVAFSPDGETLVSGGQDGKVCIRQLRDVCPEMYSG